MSGLLVHSPAHILLKLLQQLSATAWPMYVDLDPDDENAQIPDDVIVIHNTDSVPDGRSQVDGELQEHYGIMIGLRASTKPEGYQQAQALANFLDKSILRNTVSVSTNNVTNTYFVHSFSRKGGVLSLGYDAPDTKRSLYSINGLMDVRMTSPPG